MSDIDHRSFRHWGGFLLSGGTAFLVDAGGTGALIHFAGLDRFTARFLAIAVAMMVAWLLHRRVTFNVSTPPSLREFLRFSTVAWAANALNYVIYAAIVWFWPVVPWLVALVFSTGIAALFSYAGFRLGVFRELPPPA